MPHAPGADFTITVPVYRTPLRLVVAALRSALAQTGSAAFDVVVVDDGSGGDYQARLSELVDGLNDHRVRLILDASNRGLAAARNAAARASTREFVILLDADDLLTAGAVSAFSAAANTNIDVIHADHALLNTTGTRVLEVRRKGQYHALHERYKGWIHDPMLHAAFVFHPQAFRREALLAVGGFDETYVDGGHEFDLCLRLTESRLGVNIAHLPAVLYGYRLNPKSAVRDPVGFNRLQAGMMRALAAAARRRELPMGRVRRLGRVAGVTHYEWNDPSGATIQTPYTRVERTNLQSAS